MLQPALPLSGGLLPLSVKEVEDLLVHAVIVITVGVGRRSLLIHGGPFGGVELRKSPRLQDPDSRS